MQPSNPIPVLVASLVCDVAVQEPATGKRSLIGIFDRLHAVAFPASRPMTVYIKLTDALGEYKLRLQFVNTRTGKTLGDATGELTSESALQAVDAHVSFPVVQFPDPGRYEFRVFADEIYLGSAVVDAVAAESVEKGDGP